MIEDADKGQAFDELTRQVQDEDPLQLPEISVARQLVNQGFVHLPGLVPDGVLQIVDHEWEQIVAAEYTGTHLAEHSVYPSYSSDSRTSHAVMFARQPGALPALDISPYPALGRLAHLHDDLLESVLGPVPRSSRVFCDVQNYLGNSEPVPEHFDGEFLKLKSATQRSIDLIEGVLPKFVVLVTLDNESADPKQGVVLKELITNTDFTPPSEKGDVLIFDNHRFRQQVPELAEKRKVVGLRTVDFASAHYVTDATLRLPETIYERFHDGLLARDIDPVSVLKRFTKNDWPAVWGSTKENKGVF